MAKKKAVKKASARKVSTRKTAAKPVLKGDRDDIPDLSGQSRKHVLHLHNLTRSPANWQLSGGGNRVRGVTPPGSRSHVRVDHAGRGYKITFWRKPNKKSSCKIGPAGSAIFTGSKIHVTQPH